MFNNYIKIAFRNILKGKTYSFINIFGLSVAIAACLLIGIYIAQELSFVVAFPFAWLAINRWLEQFAFRVDPDWWFFAIAGVISIIIALVTVFFQVIKTALANPVEALRSE